MDKNLEQELLALREDYMFCNKFRKLQDIMYRIAVSKGWHNPSKSFGEQVVMMHSELSEAIEAYRTEDGDAKNIWHSHPYEPSESGMSITQGIPSDKPEGVPIEFADLQIRLLDTCGYYGIDLIDAIIMKAKYNLSRSQRHGNKKI